MPRLARVISIGYLVVCLASVGLMSVLGPLGYAPFPLPIGPGRTPIIVSIAASSESQAWLGEATRRFALTDTRVAGHPITIAIESAGSNALEQQIAQGQRMPVVFIPASTAQVALLQSAWQRQGSGSASISVGSEAPQSLVTTPLVIVAWQERGRALWPNGPQNVWRELRDALNNPAGWQGFGQPAWGQVKFGHTRPTASNSGLQTVLLLAYAFANKTSGLSSADIANPAFGRWLAEIEGNVSAFSDSTDGLMTDMLRFGPSKYDIVATYENLAIQSFDSAQGRGDALHVYYPPATIMSDHPYVILNAAWVTTEQRRAAEAFRAYLLSAPMQQLALEYGFRPTNPAVSIISADAANPFVKYKSYGLDIGGSRQQVQIPPADVLAGLTQLWQQQVNR